MIWAKRKRITCNSGLTMSVQTSSTHYCTPRTDTGPWHEVEVGYPSARVGKLIPYAEKPDKPTKTVYAYVPFNLVLEVVNENGGLADGSVLQPATNCCNSLA